MYTKELDNSGFDFSLFDRNTSLESKVTPFANKYTKTGTTICAVMHKTGVVFAADTRATAGSVVMDLDCIKVHSLSDNIIAAGAGTAADLFATINMISAELQMQKMNTGSENRLSHVENRLHEYLFRHMGYIGVALIIGGFDINGADIVSFILVIIILSDGDESKW
jgi:20S proteasome subunit beta 2